MLFAPEFPARPTRRRPLRRVLVGTTLLATTAPVAIAPAMHTEMWRHPSTQANIQTLRERGVHILGPAEGELTGGDSGPGRMREPEDLFADALALLAPQDLADLLPHLLAGPWTGPPQVVEG